MPGPPRGVLRRTLHVPVVLYRAHLGWVLGHRFVLLRHVGRRTGQCRETVLEVLRYDVDRREAIVMSGFGPRADWIRNLQAGGPASVAIGRRRFTARHRILEENEAVEVLADYERRNRLIGPLVRAVLSRLLGWRYSATDLDRRRAVAQLPLVALSEADCDHIS